MHHLFESILVGIDWGTGYGALTHSHLVGDGGLVLYWLVLVKTGIRQKDTH